MARYEEVFIAMAARGFCEEIKLSEFGALNRMDRLFGSLFLLVGIVFLWM
jgi:hypothetical protein